MADNSLQLKHFSREEFARNGVEWWPHLDTYLLLALDKFRDALGAPVIISPDPQAVGRHWGADQTSQHNIDKWGTVFAVDVMPQVDDMRECFELARGLDLFHGIGVYPDWRPHWGLHLDTRTERTGSNPALWSGLLVDGKQQYFGIERAWQ